MSLDETFLDCHDGADAPELFIVEGTSAADAVEQARDPSRQAVLAVRGKPINVESARKGEIDRNERVRDVVDAVRLGSDGDGALRWDAVYLLTGPDVDGTHTRALLLLLFDLLLRDVVEAGKLRMVRAPLWAVVSAEHPTPVFADTDEQRDAVFEQMRQRKMTGVGGERYQGIASMNADRLWMACLDPATRRETTLTREHAAGARRAFAAMRAR